MSPIRRRTFFGQFSIQGLKNLISLKNNSSIELRNLKFWGEEPTVDLFKQNSDDVEIRLAAKRELERRLEREAEGRAKLEKNKGRRL
jgi:hypothetical protein